MMIAGQAQSIKQSMLEATELFVILHSEISIDNADNKFWSRSSVDRIGVLLNFRTSLKTHLFGS